MTNKPIQPDDEILTNKHLLPYGSSRLDPAISLVDRAREIQNAHEIVEGQLHGKLDLIQKQIRHLQKQALELLNETQTNLELHKIKCNFEKMAGQAIHLYKKADGLRYFSLLSPMDWQGQPPHEFLGSYTMHSDRSFQKLPEE